MNSLDCSEPQSHSIRQSQTGYSSHYQYIGSIATEQPALHPNTHCGELGALFRKQDVEAFCLTEDGYVRGLITRKDIFQTMASQYGYALYARRAVSLIMNTNPLIVDYYESVLSVSEQAMKRSSDKMYDPIIVIKGSKHYGMVSVRDLLQYSMKCEMDYAKELNPLTQLPGNRVINRVLNDILVYGTQAAIFYFDIDHFKAYNDIYGFEKGDQLIFMVSRVIQNVIKGKNAINTFVGHIGGDDFVAVVENTEPEVLNGLCLKILGQFSVEIQAFFSEAHKEAGKIVAEDRNGISVVYELTSLSIGVLYGELTQISDVGVLAEYMASIKKGVKKISGNAYRMFTLEAFDRSRAEAVRSVER